jgi:hypothetical protein
LGAFEYSALNSLEESSKMEIDEWVKRYLKEEQRLGHMTADAAAAYRSDDMTAKLLYNFPEDPEGAAIYMAWFADRIPLAEKPAEAAEKPET